MAAHLRRTTRSLLLIAALAGVLLGGVATAQAKGPSRTTQRLTLRSYAITMSNNSLRYLHTTWFARNYSYNTTEIAGTPDASGTPGATQTVEILAPVGGFSAGEIPIRSQASALYATAIALNSGYYNAKTVTVSKNEALRRTVAWTTALAYSYDRNEWGQGWQSGLWAYYMGYGAKQVWSSLPPITRDLVARDVAKEADHLLNDPPPFYKDATGTVLFPGDSKSEENAWNASLLMLAAREFPQNPHAAQWETQARWYMITAYAAPSQVGSDPRITGSNLNQDGTVTNHGIIHPDYMMTIAELQAKAAMIAAHTHTSVPVEARNNFVPVWRALTRYKFMLPYFRWPGGTIYRRGPHWTTTDRIYYPQGSDWSQYRRFNAAEMDVEAFAIKTDSMSYGWAKAHMLYVLKQQRRQRDRHIFSRGQTNFPEDEQFAAVTAAEMVSRLGAIR